MKCANSLKIKHIFLTKNGVKTHSNAVTALKCSSSENKRNVHHDFYFYWVKLNSHMTRMQTNRKEWAEKMCCLCPASQSCWLSCTLSYIYIFTDQEFITGNFPLCNMLTCTHRKQSSHVQMFIWPKKSLQTARAGWCKRTEFVFFQPGNWKHQLTTAHWVFHPISSVVLCFPSRTKRITGRNTGPQSGK